MGIYDKKWNPKIEIGKKRLIYSASIVVFAIVIIFAIIAVMDFYGQNPLFKGKIIQNISFEHNPLDAGKFGSTLVTVEVVNAVGKDIQNAEVKLETGNELIVFPLTEKIGLLKAFERKKVSFAVRGNPAADSGKGIHSINSIFVSEQINGSQEADLIIE